jgi:hypothetical protein
MTVYYSWLYFFANVKKLSYYVKKEEFKNLEMAEYLDISIRTV